MSVAQEEPMADPIEPMWIHGKRRVIEPERVLSPREVAARVYDTVANPLEPFLTASNYVP